jgi:hypothetical protein
MRKLIAICMSLAILASPTFAAKQYWIVEQSINSCTVTDEKPKSTITIRGNNDVALPRNSEFFAPSAGTICVSPWSIEKILLDEAARMANSLECGVAALGAELV